MSMKNVHQNNTQLWSNNSNTSFHVSHKATSYGATIATQVLYYLQPAEAFFSYHFKIIVSS
jgi:hypothetical protein